MGHVEPDPSAAQREVMRFAAPRAAAMARAARLCIGIAAFLAATAACGAEIKVVNAWVRPMLAGDKAIPAFVDIKTDVGVTLVGVSSPLAKSVAIMLKGNDGTESETSRFDVAAAAGPRPALELREALETKLNGSKVPLQLTFVDDKGKRIVVETMATVRGILPRSMAPPDAGD